MAKTQKSRGIFKTGVGQRERMEIHKQKKKKNLAMYNAGEEPLDINVFCHQ